MAFTQEKLDAVYGRTNGQCHLCRRQLARSSYAAVGARGAWEVEHSKPCVKGGTDHGNNLFAACISCNRKKGANDTRTARKHNGYKKAPYSKKQKTKNAWTGAGTAAGLAMLLVPPQVRVLAMVLSAAIGALLGASAEPD